MAEVRSAKSARVALGRMRSFLIGNDARIKPSDGNVFSVLQLCSVLPGNRNQDVHLPNQGWKVSHALCTRTPTCRTVSPHLSDPVLHLRQMSQFGWIYVSQIQNPAMKTIDKFVTTDIPAKGNGGFRFDCEESIFSDSVKVSIPLSIIWTPAFSCGIPLIGVLSFRTTRWGLTGCQRRTDTVAVLHDGFPRDRH